MMLSAMPMTSLDTGPPSGISGASQTSDGGFDQALFRAMDGSGPAGTPASDAANAAQNQDPKVSLEGILERMHSQWQIFAAAGGKNLTADASTLDLLKKMIEGSGISEEAQESFLALLDGADEETLSMGSLLEKLKALAENSEDLDSETQVDTAFLSMGAVPFITTLLQGMGIPEDRIQSLMDRSMKDGAGFSLDRLADEWAGLRKDITEGTLALGEQGVGRDKAIRMLDNLLEGTRALGAGEKKTGFSQDTASLLERTVLASMEKKDLGETLESQSPAFDLAGQEVSADFMREIQPGGEPVGVTEDRAAALGKGVVDSRSLEGGDEKTSADHKADYEDLLADTEAGSEGFPVNIEAGNEDLSLAEETAVVALQEKVSRKEASAKVFALESAGDDQAVGVDIARATGGFENPAGGEGKGNSQGNSRETWNGPAALENKAGEGERHGSGDMPMQNNRSNETVTSRSAPAPPPPTYVLDQVARKMGQAVKEGQNDVSFQLNPESLGRLHLHIESVAGGVNVRILAEQKGTQEMLYAQVAELKAQMQEQGMRVESIEVSVAPDFDTALFQEKERERESRKSRKEENKAVSGMRGTGSKGAESVSVMRPGIHSNASLNLIA